MKKSYPVNGKSMRHSSVIKNIFYDADLGFTEDSEEQSFSELYFNLGVHQKFINAFLVNLVPLFVVRGALQNYICCT